MPDALQPYVGQIAGVATALLWTVTSICFTAAGKRISVTAVNFSRMIFAIVILAAVHRATFGIWWPHALPRQLILLAVSGFVGLSVGDQALFTALVDIGPRLSTLVMTTAPVFAAIFGWLVLGESITTLAMLGMTLTISGIAWAVLERPAKSDSPKRTHMTRGICCALLGGLCQGGGLLLSKQGMGHGWLDPGDFINPQAATLIRVAAGVAGLLPLITLRWVRYRTRIRPEPIVPNAAFSGYTFAFIGAIVGPFLGIWMSLVAADNAPLGVAQTLCSMAPVFVLPAVAIVYRERITLRAAAGAILAVAGSALLFIDVPAG